MGVNKFLLSVLLAFCLFGKALASEEIQNVQSTETGEKAGQKTVASWTFLVYIAADNSLASYASYNINDMSAGLASTNDINVLVQWDKPADKKTWRYKITPGGKIDAGTIVSEMGYNPATELYNSMQWAVANYPANHYALVLWDHGSGIEDFYPGSTKNIFDMSKWLYLLPSLSDRGILYDDSQDTCLTNQGLTSALTNIKKLLGKNLDVIAMDACLMAMVEVAYQMNGLVNIFVGSEQTIPGEGYPYSQFIRPLSLNPATTSPLQLAQNMVTAYKNFYTTEQPTSDFTLSAIDITSIDSIKQNVTQFITAIAACSKIDAAKTKSMVLAARKASISFEMPEYIDLYSFYANILNKIKKTSPKSAFILEKHNPKPKPNLRPRPNPKPKPTPQPTQSYQTALNALNVVVQAGLNQISKVILQEDSGPVYAGAKGISIYYPSNGQIDSSYKLTLFAKNTSWVNFIQTYR